MHIGLGLIITHLKSIHNNWKYYGYLQGVKKYTEPRNTRSHEIHGAKLHKHKYTELINTEPSP